MPTTTILRAMGTGARCRATPAFNPAEEELHGQQHSPALAALFVPCLPLCYPHHPHCQSSAALYHPATFKTCTMPFQARPATYTLTRSVTSLILHFWMAKIRQKSATPFYFFKAFNTFYSALMHNMPAVTACNQSKNVRFCREEFCMS